MQPIDTHIPTNTAMPNGLTLAGVHSAQEELKSRKAVLIKANELNDAKDKEKKSRAAVYHQYSAQIPTNDFGLPTFIYRPDIIPPDIDLYTPEQRTAILQAASVSVVYDGGYPVFEDGSSFWSRFPWEPADSYEMFQRFVDMPSLTTEVMDSTTSRLDNSASDRTTIQIAVRDLNILASLYPAAQDSPLSKLTPAEYVAKIREYAILYCWTVRVKAYDLFIAAAYRKWREQRVYSTEQSHFRLAEKLLAKANTELLLRLDDPDQKEEIKAKELLDVVKSMIQVQRVSLGLSMNGGNGSGADGDPPKNASLELTLRSIAKNAGEESKQIQSQDAVQEILNDPDALIKAQELIIRMNRR